MKLRLYILIILFNANPFYSQSIEDLITDIRSDNKNENISAMHYILDQEISDVMPDIIEVYNDKPPVVQLLFLKALYLFEYEDVYNLTIDFIQNIDSYPPDELDVDPLEAKVEATAILFSLDDFTTYNYIFELLNRDGIQNLSPAPFHLLNQIMNNIPEEELNAKQIYLTIWDESSVASFRYYSMYYLTKKYGSAMSDLILNSFTNDSDRAIRRKALFYLIYYNYKNLQNILKARLSFDFDHTIRIEIADTLLKHFGEPSDLKAVIDHQPNEPNETASSLMDYSITNFIPPKPDTLDWYGLTTRLISYTNEMYGYAWILNTQTRDYYLIKLNGIIESLTETSQIDEACSIIETQILPQLENDLNVTESITIEAYKFLHHYTKYIKEELEEQYGACP